MHIRIGKTDIAYDLDGPPEGPVVVLGHCFSANRNLWKGQIPPLVQAGFRVLRHDVRGHGETRSPPPDSLADLAADINGLLDALHIDRAHLLGISMSGMVAQWFALNHQERLQSLVLANTTSVYSPVQREAWRERIFRLQREGPNTVVESVLPRWFAPASLQNNVHGVELMRQGFLTMPDDMRFALTPLIASVDTTDRLGEIKIPTLVIVGADDVATPPEAGELLHQRIPNSEIVVIPESGHISPTEQPAAFNEALLGFLGRQTTR